MSEDADRPKPNIVEIAKKKRHLYLFQKLQQGKALSPAELRELEKLENVSVSDGVVDTKEKVAKSFGVSVRTIYYWQRDGMPQTREGNYDLLEIKAWRMAKENARQKHASEKDKWQALFRKNKALLAEIEYKRAKKELLPRHEVEAKQILAVQAVKTALLTLPNILAPQLAMKEPREIFTELTSVIRDIIAAFAKGYSFEVTGETENNSKI